MDLLIAKGEDNLLEHGWDRINLCELILHNWDDFCSSFEGGSVKGELHVFKSYRTKRSEESMDVDTQGISNQYFHHRIKQLSELRCHVNWFENFVSLVLDQSVISLSKSTPNTPSVETSVKKKRKKNRGEDVQAAVIKLEPDDSPPKVTSDAEASVSHKKKKKRKKQRETLEEVATEINIDEAQATFTAAPDTHEETHSHKKKRKKSRKHDEFAEVVVKLEPGLETETPPLHDDQDVVMTETTTRKRKKKGHRDANENREIQVKQEEESADSVTVVEPHHKKKRKSHADVTSQIKLEEAKPKVSKKKKHKDKHKRLTI